MTLSESDWAGQKGLSDLVYSVQLLLKIFQIRNYLFKAASLREKTLRRG